MTHKCLQACIVLAALVSACQTPTTPLERRMAVRDATLAYRVHGSNGPPVVFVHGCCSDQRAWPDSLTALAAGRRIVTFDQRYYGTAPWSDRGERFSTETQIEDLAAFVRGLGMGPVHLVGWSMSGASILGVAIRHPQWVSSLFVYEPSVASLITDPAEQKAAAEGRSAQMAPVVAQVKAGDHAQALRLMMDGANGRPGTFEALPADFRANQIENLRVLPLLFGAPAPPRIGCEQLAHVKVPAAIARGADTPVFYRLAADAAARCLGNAKAIVVPGASHMWPALEAQAFTALVQGWLEVR